MQSSHRRHATPLLLALPVYVVASACGNDAASSPEHSVFRVANQKIETYDGLQSFGNSANARDLAARFSRLLVAIREEHFESNDPAPATQPVITYCRLDPQHVCFLSNMPELARFPRESRELLAELSWHGARTILGLQLPANAEIAVGIRGSGWFYGITAIGKASDDMPVTQAGWGVDSAALYRFFPSDE